jgi:hypothetical protein
MQAILLSALFAAFLFAGTHGCMRLGWRIGPNACYLSVITAK